jgi:hypothetical protein
VQARWRRRVAPAAQLLPASGALRFVLACIEQAYRLHCFALLRFALHCIAKGMALEVKSDFVSAGSPSVLNTASLSGDHAGFRPGNRVHSFASPKERNQEKATRVCRPAARGPHASGTEIGKRRKLAALRQPPLLFPISIPLSWRHTRDSRQRPRRRPRRRPAESRAGGFLHSPMKNARMRGRFVFGGVDGTRTRDPRRDRPVF